MNLLSEEKKHICSEINHQTNNRPLFYLKFCSEERFANDVCNGNLYGNTAEYFRRKEIETGERGQGDKYETILNIDTQNITAIDNETGNIAFIAPKGVVSIKFEADLLIPIVSFVGISVDETTIIESTEEYTDFLLPFSEEEYNSLEEKFGEYCVIIAGNELEKKINNYCSSNGYEYLFDKVTYCNPNRIDRIEAFRTGSKERFLYKNEDLSFQREYRLAIGIEIPDDHFIRIGKLTSARCIESKKLKNLFFRVNYKIL